MRKFLVVCFLLCLGCEHEANEGYCKTIIQCEESHEDRTCFEQEDGCYHCEEAYMEFCVERMLCGEELIALEREGKMKKLENYLSDKKIY